MKLIIFLFFPVIIFGQSISDKEFMKRLEDERGNYPIQNYNQDFLDRPGFVWGVIKSKNDNLIYLAAKQVRKVGYYGAGYAAFGKIY